MLNYAVDHVGFAVRDLNLSIDWYKSNFGLELSLREEIESQGVEVAFLKLPCTKIELLAPLSPASKLTAFLSKRGEGFHHICYRVENIVAELQRLESLGFQIIDKDPRPGAHGSLIAFIHPKSMGGVLTELCQY